ncbi:uncharacterized protein K489DRAFT_183461 [Dissoconium aciculare CBS 342.82]|uniref:Uncharacterized protein n=1 Tax=Dissoconium aciculare CBS 342.82 TaxID=1314786 RepID=A0A6J3MA23_9PEZI|nr:uncharacterized protein K489DRAFT_183461 [Dissoconium aciculare CBS 342.82]KAF1824479.1 hypothetical protein K489DRAFT_183461 [Dissoconium aciculare CBS 342.82]
MGYSAVYLLHSSRVWAAHEEEDLANCIGLYWTVLCCEMIVYVHTRAAVYRLEVHHLRKIGNVYTRIIQEGHVTLSLHLPWVKSSMRAQDYYFFPRSCLFFPHKVVGHRCNYEDALDRSRFR